jgi:hypothetical protein
MQDQVLVLGLAPRGRAPDSRWIARSDVVWWRLISSFVHALTRCVPLAETRSEARFYHGIQVGCAAGLARVRVRGRHCPTGSGDLVFP